VQTEIVLLLLSVIIIIDMIDFMHCFSVFCVSVFSLSVPVESTSKSGKPNTNTVQFLNLQYISNIQLITEAPDAKPPPLPNLNYSKVQYVFHVLISSFI